MRERAQALQKVLQGHQRPRSEFSNQPTTIRGSGNGQPEEGHKEVLEEINERDRAPQQGDGRGEDTTEDQLRSFPVTLRKLPELSG